MEYKSYNIYRGLQRPFNLFGLKGINIAWGAGGGLVGFIAFAVSYITLGFFMALLITACVAGFCIYKINYHNTYGLHNKNRMKGIWIAKNLIKSTYRN